MTPLPPTDPPADCAAFDRLAQAVLDGDRPAAALDHPHAAACPDCRRHAAAVRVLLGALAAGRDRPTPPAGFADRVVRAARRDRRVRAYRRAGAGFAVAAGLLAAAVALRPPAPVPHNDLAKAAPEPRPEPAPPPVRVGDRFAEAGSALAALTRRTADETIAPTRDLLPPVEPPGFGPVAVLPPEAGPAVESLAEMPNAARAGFEPVADTARRAVNLFLRDTGLSAPGKPAS